MKSNNKNVYFIFFQITSSHRNFIFYFKKNKIENFLSNNLQVYHIIQVIKTNA